MGSLRHPFGISGGDGMKTRLFSGARPLFAVVSLLFLALPAFAQNAEIAGVVRDTSGAVLPGVTVEAYFAKKVKGRVVFEKWG